MHTKRYVTQWRLHVSHKLLRFFCCRHWFFVFVSTVFFNGFITLYLCNTVWNIRGFEWAVFLGGLETLIFLVIAALVFVFSVSMRSVISRVRGWLRLCVCVVKLCPYTHHLFLRAHLRSCLFLHLPHSLLLFLHLPHSLWLFLHWVTLSHLATHTILHCVDLKPKVTWWVHFRVPFIVFTSSTTCCGLLSLVFCLYIWYHDDVTRWYYPVGILELLFFLGIASAVTGFSVSSGWSVGVATNINCLSSHRKIH